MTPARGIWAVVPMKSFARGKSRLSAALGDDERSALARQMFTHVLSVTRELTELDGSVVVTNGDDVAAVASAAGARVLRDPSAAQGLAQVVDSALAQLERDGASYALVLMADLPHLQATDLRAVLAARSTADVVVVADTADSFTNALLVPLGRGYTTCFGSAGSAQRHLARAEALGLRAQQLESSRIAFDVDTPDDAKLRPR